jgi:Arc/MetJ family transcription regulator
VKTTIDIPENELKEAMQYAQVKTKRDAVLAALREYNRRQRVEKIIAKFGTMDGIMTQAELRRMREES